MFILEMEGSRNRVAVKKVMTSVSPRLGCLLCQDGLSPNSAGHQVPGVCALSFFHFNSSPTAGTQDQPPGHYALHCGLFQRLTLGLEYNPYETQNATAILVLLVSRRVEACLSRGATPGELSPSGGTEGLVIHQ